MVRPAFVLLWVIVASLAMQQVIAKDAKQEKSEQTEKKSDDKQSDDKGKAEEEEAETETEPIEDILGRSSHLPQYLEMPEDPPESSPAKLGELREEKEQ